MRERGRQRGGDGSREGGREIGRHREDDGGGDGEVYLFAAALNRCEGEKEAEREDVI